MPTMDSVGTATAEALCAAMPLAPAPQARLQSYTQKAGEALAQRDAAKHHMRWTHPHRRDVLRRRKSCCEVDDEAPIGLYGGFRYNILVTCRGFQSAVWDCM